MKLAIVDRNQFLTQGLRRLLERRVRFALSRFDDRIQRTTVTLEDVNGPRGGADKCCKVVVKLQRARDVVCTDQDTNIAKSITHATERAGRAVARALERSTPTAISRLAAQYQSMN